jgi:hypothetical protein
VGFAHPSYNVALFEKKDKWGEARQNGAKFKKTAKRRRRLAVR